MDTRNRRSIRLQGYDYSQAGAYYVTICTQDRACLFGQVKGGEMVLNEVGKIVEEEWLNTEKIRGNVQLDEFVIMPNHLHGIIIINDRRGVLNMPILNTPISNMFKGECHSPLRGASKNFGAIIRGYKSAVTKWFRQNTNIYNVWQRNYYEHIIRNGNDYDRIVKYIHDNPMNWGQDDLYL